MQDAEHKFFKLIILVFGSWWSVLFHTIFFILILLVFKDFLLFTTIVSIEAIYIGIFILMAEAKEETFKEKQDILRRAKDRKLIKEDININKVMMEEVELIKTSQERIISLLDKYNMNVDLKEQSKKHITDNNTTPSGGNL